MKKIISYIRTYFIEVDKRILILSAFFIGFFIFLNYYYALNHHISKLSEGEQYLSWYFVFLIAFSFAYVLLAILHKRPIFRNKGFLFLFFFSPAIFSWKMVSGINISFTSDRIQNLYWNQVAYWPFKLMVLCLVLLLIWRFSREEQPFYGMSLKGFSFKPYVLMLLIMVPLIAIASTQHDFLAMYPKLKSVSFLKNQSNNGWYKIIY